MSPTLIRDSSIQMSEKEVDGYLLSVSLLGLGEDLERSQQHGVEAPRGERLSYVSQCRRTSKMRTGSCLSQSANLYSPGVNEPFL